MSERWRRWSCLDRYETVIKDIPNRHKRSYKLGDLAHRGDRLEREGRARGSRPREQEVVDADGVVTCRSTWRT
jgi:hypothetical protein